MTPAPEPADEETGLPALRTWRAVYWAVTAIFIIVVGLLLALPKVFQ